MGSRGVDSRMVWGGMAAARLEQGPKSSTTLGEKTERRHEGAFLVSGGEGGIRTHERLQTFAGFQDQCIQPLCHLSELSGAPGGWIRRVAAHPSGRTSCVLTARVSRTHERLQTFAGFQDQCIQPLCHLSELSCAPGGMDSPPVAAHPFGAHFVRPDSLRESVEPTKGYKPLLVFKTSALTRAIPGARPAGALRASESAVLPIGQPLCHLSRAGLARGHCACSAVSIQHAGLQFPEPRAACRV